MRTVTGVFPRSALALRAGERACEAAGARGRIRVLVPGAAGEVIETVVSTDRYSRGPVTLLGLLLGVAFLLLGGVLGRSWGMGLSGLVIGVLMGVMLGEWLTGESQERTRRPLAEAGEFEALLRAGRSVVVAVVEESERGAVMAALAASGGRVTDGPLVEAEPAGRAPLPA